MIEHSHDPVLVLISILISMVAAYTALALASRIYLNKSKNKIAWLAGGACAMGVGVWSQHFIGILAFNVSGVEILYHKSSLILSVILSILAFAFALFVICRENIKPKALALGSIIMSLSLVGVHYFDIFSMEMNAKIHLNYKIVIVSILIAAASSFMSFRTAFKLRFNDRPITGKSRIIGALLIGLSISSIHYISMAAISIIPHQAEIDLQDLLPTEGLGVLVTATSVLILSVALIGSILDRALTRQTDLAQKTKNILESITDGFLSVDRNWNITFINKAGVETFHSVLNRRDCKPRGRTLWDLIPEVVNTRFEAEYRRAMDTGKQSEFEEYFQPFDRWLDVRVYPSKDGLSIYFKDSTEKKNMELALRDAIKHREDFLSLASHELKTPLTALLLTSQLRERKIMKGESQDLMNEISLLNLFRGDTQKIMRMTTLVDEMLDVSKLASGKITLNKEPEDINKILEYMVNQFTQTSEMINSLIVFYPNPEPLVASIDRVKFEQVLNNLITNAIRYGNGKPIFIHGKKERGLAVIEVRDQGIGIQKTDQLRIFNRFEQVVEGGQKNSVGLGLGLYITKEIVGHHGGSIEVQSLVGEGSTFRVSLPLAG